MKASRREVASWCLYDFSSSAFNTLIVTFIFSLYFAEVIADDPLTGAAQWAQALNLSAVVVAIAMPVLGAVADYSGRKKLFLVLAALTAITFTVLLFFASAHSALLALGVFVIANIGFESGNVFYNAFLPELTTRENIGRVSGTGFFLGYTGGLIALALGLGMVSGWLPETGDLNVRGTILLVAVWYLVFSLPMFLLVRERAPRRGAPPGGYAREGFRRIAETVGHLRAFREAAKLVVARMIYNDGLTTVIAMASIYAAAVFGMSMQEVLQMGVALNVAAGAGAFAFGFLDDRIGGKKTLVVTLVVLIIAGIIGVTSTSTSGFWVAAVLIGLMMGPNQSASRSLLARLTPEQKHTEFFGLFAFSGKLSSMLGPIAFYTVLRATENYKLAMSSIIAFFAVGLLVLLTVREKEGIARANELEQDLADGRLDGLEAAR